jgi:hypothetical protein
MQNTRQDGFAQAKERPRYKTLFTAASGEGDAKTWASGEMPFRGVQDSSKKMMKTVLTLAYSLPFAPALTVPLNYYDILFLVYRSLMLEFCPWNFLARLKPMSGLN